MVWTALNSVMRKCCRHLCRLSGLGAFWGLGQGLFVAMSSVSHGLAEKCTLGRLVCWNACMMHFRLWKYKYAHTCVYPLQLEVLCRITYYILIWLKSAEIGACRSPMNTSHPLSADAWSISRQSPHSSAVLYIRTDKQSSCITEHKI